MSLFPVSNFSGDTNKHANRQGVKTLERFSKWQNRDEICSLQRLHMSGKMTHWILVSCVQTVIGKQDDNGLSSC